MEILGVDIGGSGIKGAIVRTDTGEVTTERVRIPTPKPATPEAIAGTLKELVATIGYCGPVACGFPATVNRGIVKTAANIDKSWVMVNAEKLFSATLGQQVFVANDADLAGVAEMKFGAGKGREELKIIVLTVGTGIGSAIFLGGRLYPNSELGHLFFKNDIAEKYCSAAARERDGIKWREFGERFTEYLQHLELVLQPDLIIIGGGASKKFEKFCEELHTDAKVIPAQSLNMAGIIGAAIYGEERLKALQQP